MAQAQHPLVDVIILKDETIERLKSENERLRTMKDGPRGFAAGDTLVVQVLMPDGVMHHACVIEPDQPVRFDWPAVEHGANLTAEKPYVAALCRALLRARYDLGLTEFSNMSNPRAHTQLTELMEAGYFGASAYAKEHGISVQRARQLAVRAWHELTINALILPNDARHLPDDWPLDKVPLTKRARNVLADEGLTTVADVRSRSDDQLLAIANLGQVSLRWLRHVTALADGPHREKFESTIERLERENASLRARVRRVIDAAKAAAQEGPP